MEPETDLGPFTTSKEESTQVTGTTTKWMDMELCTILMEG
jgi:hypothetical protein